MNVEFKTEFDMKKTFLANVSEFGCNSWVGSLKFMKEIYILWSQGRLKAHFCK